MRAHDDSSLRAALTATDPTLRSAAQHAYMRHIEATCEDIIQHEPTALAAIVDAIPLELLEEPRDQQLICYYRGLALGLQDHTKPALAALDQLLAEPALDERIRGRALNSAAIFAQAFGDYQRASDYYAHSLHIWQTLGDGTRQGLALLNMGILRYELQQYAEAETHLQASAAFFQTAEHGYRRAQVDNELGLLYRDQGRWNDALDSFQRTLAHLDSQRSTDAAGRVTNNIGEVELLRGAFAAAHACFQRALTLMTTRYHAIDAHINLGLLAQACDDDRAALAHYQDALDVAQQIERRDILPLIWYRQGHAAQRLGDTTRAAVFYETAIAHIETTREPLREEGLLIELMGRWQHIYEAAIAHCLRCGDPAGAFAYAERARARAFADMLARRGGLDTMTTTPISAIEAQNALPPDTLLLAYFASGLHGPEANLLAAIPQHASTLRDCLAPAPQLICFALSTKTLDVHHCPLDPNALQATPAAWTDGERFLRPTILRRAYDALIAPIAAHLIAAHHLVIVPHGPLHHLPFAALLDTANQPLLDRIPQLSTAPSATVLLRNRPTPPPPPQRPCLALGYNDENHGLRHTEAEATAIAHLCGGDTWPPAPNTAARLIAEARHYRWLHIACHGEFNLQEPLASWLAIGPDVRLSAADVLRDLRIDADIVVLSACRSGISHIVRGDEPLGLVRAFMNAGAHAVIVTLWRVEDLSARLLMEHFYTELLTHTNPAAALHAAQQHLRTLSAATIHRRLAEQGEPRANLPPGEYPFAAPIFWAGFVLIQGTPPTPAALLPRAL